MPSILRFSYSPLGSTKWPRAKERLNLSPAKAGSWFLKRNRDPRLESLGYFHSSADADDK